MLMCLLIVIAKLHQLEASTPKEGSASFFQKVGLFMLAKFALVKLKAGNSVSDSCMSQFFFYHF